MTESIRVLHVDDDPAFVELTAEWLARESTSFDVAVETAAADGLAYLEDHPVDCVVSDFDMPHMDGLGFLEAVRSAHPDLPFILFTGKGSEEVAADAIAAGVTDYLQKTGDSSQYTVLANRIENAVERRRTSRELAASRRRLALLFEASPMGAIEWTDDLSIARINETARSLLGDDSETLVGATHADMVPEGAAEDFAATLRAAEAGPQEAVVVGADGSEFVCEWYHREVTDADESVLTRFSQFTDVTDRSRRRLELRTMHALSSTLFDALPVGVLAETADRTVLTANERLFELFDLDIGPDDIAGRDCRDLIEAFDDVVDADRLRSHIETCIASETDTTDAVFERQDGSVLELYHRPIDLPDGDGHLWVYDDVTDRAETAASLSDELADLEALHEATNRLYAAATVDDCCDITIETAVSILGFDWCLLGSPDESTGRWRIRAASPGSPLSVGDLSLDLEAGLIGEAYRTGESFLVGDVSDDDRAEPARETIRSVLTVPVGDWGVLQAISTDVDAFDERDLRHGELLAEAMRTAADLTESQREVERQRNRLDDFTSVVSHDLRNPLAVARGRLDLVEGTDGDAEHLSHIDGALERMDELIEHLLVLAREGSALGEREPLELAEVVRNAWQTVEAPAASLEVDCACTLRADPTRLRQALENLLRNAVEHGGEDVTIRVGEHETGFFVEDDGPGIPPADREAVFEAGYSTGDRDTGVGLAIAEEIVEAHGWSIEATAGRDGGARFAVAVIE